MSLYAELRRGPVRARAVRAPRFRAQDIYSRMHRSRHNRTMEARSCYNGACRRHKPRAASRDLAFQKSELMAEDQAWIDKMEKEMERELEKNRLEEARVAELKKSVLMVEKTDLHVFETTIEHRTDYYSCTDGFLGQLVLRRGQEFRMTFTFQRPWSGKQDDLSLVFRLGENPKEGNGTLVRARLEEGKDTRYMDGADKAWGARILSQSENTLTVSVYTPPTAIIGQWEFSVITDFTDGSGKKTSLRCDGQDDIIIILNPWCKDDQVYMPEESDVNEYICNEHGCVFNGSHKSIGKKAWNYGQFQDNILEISLHLLRKAFDYEINTRMGDAVHIARALSRIVNASDDNGVLIGNWSGKYNGGVKPTSWKGSVAILHQYDAEKEPVKFGQCWVFSHVLTTVARALGLPCRSVTTFSSAHDTDLTLTIDRFVDDEGDIIPWETRDSIWNFHVWNEVWMSRKDLDKYLNANGKYDGWHAIDATPQETSDSLYQCGPSPVKAIQCGDVHVGFDTKFIFAEVNAEICNWRKSGEQLILADRDGHRVGKNISTKVPNGEPMNNSFFASDSDNRLDITHIYKHPEGSVAEREAVERALSGTKYCELVLANPTGIEINFEPMTSEPKLGEDVTTGVKVVNSSNETRSVRLKVTVRPMTYWGEVIGTKSVTSNTFTETKIEPNQSITFDMPIEADQYIEACDDHLSMSVLAMAYIRGFDDHQNRVFGSDDFIIKPGTVQATGPSDRVDAGEPIEMKLTFSNPTNKTLTNCQLEVEGGVEVLDSDFKKKHSVYRRKIKNVKPKEEVIITVNIKPNVKPKKSFEREVEIGVTCDQLPDFEGALQIKLKK